MFCIKCGSEIPADSKFCTNCGNQINDQTPIKAKETKKGSKKGIVIVAAIALVALIGVGIVLSEMFLINSSAKLEKKLMDTVWCSEPTSWVSVDGSGKSMVAYTVEFKDDGTAIINTYMDVCSPYEEPEAENMKIRDTKTVDWKINGRRILCFDGKEYKFKGFDDDESWSIEDGRLRLDRTYYEDDEWNYVSD